MERTIITIIIVLIISFIIFKIIKSVCKPINNLTAILLIIPTTATCGLALLIYKFLRNSIEVGNYKSTNSSDNYDIPTYEEPKKEKNKKTSKAVTDSSGKTTYYDEVGNIIGTSVDNGLGKTTYTDSEGNYVGESLNNGTGSSIYTDINGNVISSTTDYQGNEIYSDGTIGKKDSSGNTNY